MVAIDETGIALVGRISESGDSRLASLGPGKDWSA